ncbi:UNVERIFIED_CONTAM: Valine N-monooxygenase 2 [Sesamum latifolium]|uniref:Valine N-monooxygenase 2 n=1 Tax=Sesamum latifolium TaxID=2727402 RepID=A0AAW2W0N3_9LAMI
MEDGGPGLHLHGIFTILKYVYGLGIADYLPWLEVFDLDGHKTILKNAIKRVRKYQDPEIEKRVDMWQQGIRKTEEDVLDVLINLKDSNNNPLLSIHEIKAEIIEIMLAAVDNPSNAVEWALAEMINQPDILHGACQELDQVVGRDRLVDESDLSKLNYVKACVKEAFRLHPMPERHIANEESVVVLVDHELRMLSFSTGRRGCPGIVLGSTMTTLLLARLIQGFSWTAPPNEPSNIDLAESEGDMVKAIPLIAHAVPRLEPHVYPKLVL